jgi:hypothetical protein
MTDPAVPEDVREQLIGREPLFHHEPLGSSRDHFARLMVDDYWEVGASGAVYDRAFVLDTLVERHRAPHSDPWRIEDFELRELGDAAWLATYELHQDERVTRRSTIWTNASGQWKAVYHQGTLA